jgi:hypothetical protein
LSENSPKRFKPDKRPVSDDNPLAKVLDSIVSGLEQSLGKRTYLCGNPECGAVIIFHNNDPRPVVCLKCGNEIDWEGEYVTRIKICPKCNEEYDSYANFCSHHFPAVSLQEKEVEK